MSRPYLAGPRPLAFAHRGGAALWPENTLVAFEGAIRLGLRHLETDLQITRDGALVTLHDPTVDRTTDGRGPAAALTLAELQRLDAGHRFTPDGGATFPYRGQGIRVPALDEVLALHPDVCVNLEIKSPDPAAARVVWGFIHHHRVHDRVLVASEHAPVVREFRAQSRGRVATSAGAAEVLRFWLAARLGRGPRSRPDYDALQIPPTHGPLTVIHPRLVDAARRHDLHVHAWTIDDPAEMRRLIDLGVDGLVSDRPDRLVDLLRIAPDGARGPA